MTDRLWIGIGLGVALVALAVLGLGIATAAFDAPGWGVAGGMMNGASMAGMHGGDPAAMQAQCQSMHASMQPTTATG